MPVSSLALLKCGINGAHGRVPRDSMQGAQVHGLYHEGKPGYLLFGSVHDPLKTDAPFFTLNAEIGLFSLKIQGPVN